MKFIVKKQYFYIYLAIVVLFTAFYITLFAINRMQLLNKTLGNEREKIVNEIKIVESLAYSSNIYQLRYFVNCVTLIEYLYNKNTKDVESILAKNTIYDFIAITDLDGNYKFKSKDDFKFQFNVKEVFDKDAISTIIAFDRETETTYKVFTYAIKKNNKIDSYIVAYLSVDFLSNFNNIYLVSKDGYLLNKAYINDIDMNYKNLSFLYPDEWDMIVKDLDGQFVSHNGIFTFSHLKRIHNIGDIKVKQNPYYIISIISINPNDSPYFINSISSFFKYINFKINITYWIIGYIWIFGTSIILLVVIINIIKNSKIESLDGMTDAFNRRSGYAKLTKLISEFSETGIKHYINNIKRFIYFRKPINSIHFCMVDIDGLKQVNDTLGHKYGDELIVNTIDCIKKDLHRSEILIRMGGDEFLIVFLNRDFNDIDKYWKDVLQRFNDKNNSGNFKYIIKASHGVTEYKIGMDIESCIIQADELMYKEKRRHKVNLFFD
ncbi:GGDEF domain-containing protein [Helicobacter sp. 16-1353]|uniref:GGDEF domain-containing protein n=1 Tax=Helicobacter sp. 16-1353 TaxID=2004996 RepID=UPI0015EFD663|nr:GGDEF domain-containing protein [Helicobacter sp. 16-1353]